MTNILELKNIEKYYKTKNEQLHIIRGLNLELKKGEFISILGRSGSGKSTLLNIIGLLDKADSGEVYINGKNILKMSEKEIDMLKNKSLGFVFQFHYLLNEFTALENVMVPALLHNFENRKNLEKKAVEILNSVGLGERLNHFPNQLSGGEKQRVAIARALINSPDILLADEPTGNLDEETSEKIFDILKKINNDTGQSIIVVTHSKDLANITDRQYYLKKGILEK